MADAVYTRAAATALRLVTKYGQSMTLRRETAAAYSAGVATQTSVDEVVQGLDLSTVQAFKPGELVEGATGKFLLAASGMTAPPTLADQLLAGADAYAIKAVNAMNPGGLDVLYEVQVGA